MVKIVLALFLLFVCHPDMAIAAGCVDDLCTSSIAEMMDEEEFEEAEALAMRTELLQTKLDHFYLSIDSQPDSGLAPARKPTAAELVQAQVEAKGTKRTYYAKVQAYSPSWCGTINYYVQYLVPPCWVGAPNIVENGPASCPDWCKYVSSTVTEPACQPLYNGKGGCPGWPPASLLQVNEEHARAWLAEVAEESARNGTTPKAGVVPVRMPTAAELAQAEVEAKGSTQTNDTTPKANVVPARMPTAAELAQAQVESTGSTRTSDTTLKADVVPARMPTPAELAQAEVEAKGSTQTNYGKVQADSPSWCGTINYYVQYLVPPCWLGAPNIVANGPASCPDWCKYLSKTVKEPACQPLYNGKGGCAGWPPAS